MPMQQVMMMASAILSQGNENKPDIPSLSERVGRLTHAVDFWNGWMVAGLVIAAIAALWLAITTRLTIVRQKELTVAQGDLDSAKEGQLQIQLAAANLKRVELENKMVDTFGPRQLTASQSASIETKLAGLKGAKIDVYVLALGNPYSRTESDDSKKFGVALVRTLRSAHMDAEGWLLESCNGGSVSNLVVSVTGNSSDDRKIASQVLNAFPPEVGLYPEVQNESPSTVCTRFSDLDETRPNKRNHDATISIAVGRKISPLLTREMLEPDDEQNKP